MTIVCTGRSGSIGHHLPTPVKGLATRLEATEAEMLRELEPLAPKAFVHLAALTSPKLCENEPERATELNAAAPERWLRAAAKAGVERFVYVSTSHVFRPTLGETWLGPERVPDAQSAYGRSKAEGERRLKRAAAEIGVQLRIARVFSVIAPDMRSGFLYPALIERAKRRNLSPLPGWSNVRDFMPAAEVAAALMRIAEIPSAPSILHVCTGRPRTVRSLAEEVFGRFGYGPSDLAPMFVPGGSPPNYMISHPTRPEVQ